MTFDKRLLAWAAVAAILLYALYELGGVIAPFATGIAIGYLLDPVVRKLERIGFNRLGASLLILAVFLIVMTFVLIIVAPILANQLIAFTQQLPGYVLRLQTLAVDQANELVDKYAGEWRAQMGLGDTISPAAVQKAVTDFVNFGTQWWLNAVRSLVTGGAAIVNFLSFLVVTPVVAFYILVDWNKMIAAIDAWLPRKRADEFRAVAAEINRALAGFLRGQSLVCFFLGLWYGAGLNFIGLDFGLLIGVGSGLLCFVPYFGSLIALTLSIGVAIVQGWPDPHLFYLTLGVVLVGQFLEGYVLSPILVGESIGVHPVWLMFSLFAFGSMFGFVGLLIAVPASAAIGVLMRRLLAAYLAGPLYRGEGAGTA